MKTLADFKRALTLGSKWHTFYALIPQDMGIGEVVEIKSNAVAFKREGNKKPSWLYFPKASQFKINNDCVEIYWESGQHILTYKKVG